ncbi:MAG: DinB family protein, partial [Candidatus Acidiferrales bacterium]
MSFRALIEKLRHSRERFESAARAIPEPQWRIPPNEGAWSAAEIVAHVTMVETLMTGAAAKITR